MSEITNEQRDGLRSSWAAWCAELERQGARMVDEVDDVENPQELAEGLRAVARLALTALQHRTEFCDPDFPVFYRSLDDRYKYCGPDAYINYFTAPVRESATYLIRGQHHGRDLQLGQFWPRDLHVEEDGSFEVTASAAEPPSEDEPTNWQPLTDAMEAVHQEIAEVYPMAIGGLIGRVYYQDPEDPRPTAQLSIERVDDERPRYPAPLSPEQLSEQLDGATALFATMAPWWLQRPSDLRSYVPANTVSPPSSRPPATDGWELPRPDRPINYGICPWELEPDEALVVESDLPEVDYWSFQLYNAWWESPDLQHRQTSVSHLHAHVDTDGRARFVISGSDPAVPNWLDTGGARRGFLMYRWVRPRSPMPTPVVTLASVSRVREHLPEDHPVMDQAARDEQMSIRRRWFARRFQA